MRNSKGQTALTRREILRVLKSNRDALQKHKVKRIGLFGSFATGKQGKRSDIDFLVEFEEPTFDNFMGLHDYLARLFRRKIELLTPEGIQSIRIKSIAENIKKTVIYA